ncbi:hypothetical protein ACJMK2_020506 [Sinanodonta woodiana]|uniref:Uncharacterized protein n=1 Tax=Sinanodonta woodiana TaxID=1069815 RepID=A0ABD3U0P6_SINWO
MIWLTSDYLACGNDTTTARKNQQRLMSLKLRTGPWSWSNIAKSGNTINRNNHMRIVEWRGEFLEYLKRKIGVLKPNTPSLVRRISTDPPCGGDRLRQCV